MIKEEHNKVFKKTIPKYIRKTYYVYTFEMIREGISSVNRKKGDS